MFNALNRFISRLDGDPSAHQQQGQKQDHGYGFQVLRNTNLELHADPWFDYVVGINGRMIDNPDPNLFAQEVRNCAGGNVSLGIWSAKGQRTRVLHIPVPPASASASGLGLALQWAPLALAANVWHVLDVPANSPADLAGLLPYSDYILGTPDGTLHGESGLGELVEDYIGRPLKLWVYNNEYNVTRELEIVPSREWGGEGALGCVLGFGALHRLPAPLSEPVEAPGETMFDGGENSSEYDAMFGARGQQQGAGGSINSFSNTSSPAPQASQSYPPPPTEGGEFLVPAQLAPPPSTGGAIPTRNKKKDRHHGATKRGGGMDDYFAEQEKKSKELDGTISASRTPPPPPPKAGGGPPRAGSGLATPTAQEEEDS
ncbi:GRASP55/65 PDZ-like domain-containing protein [Microdochium trichocladiopsis]|uniref:GRASP55/65 PDZ-like domain-containing protein n=1 Tax=Microdochium trichocladiopsis TaxID=1682393 RepID=A0A9P8YDH0_9PEZI|nr:GRASP55/65 PDZ-like domain-containing protein [Microdochium trichocladiopsis]KAH7034946.1 GRASP55/65 PDZ-like domain-containing protein [Microdochium trichocladiopsis]